MAAGVGGGSGGAGGVEELGRVDNFLYMVYG